MSDPRGWEVLENVKNPICPLISALTFKQANKYVECVKEKCMWWSKCKGLKEARPHGEWRKYHKTDDVTTVCSACGYDTEDKVYFHFCPNCGADMRKEGEAE